MESLAATSLAANIFQLVEFASKVIKRLQEFRDSYGEIPKVFRGISTRLPLLVEDLKKCGHDEGTTEANSAIMEVLTSCQTQITKLDGILVDILPLQGDSWTTKNKKALMSIKKEKVVNRIENELQKCMGLLTFHHVLPSPANFLHKADSGLGMMDEDLVSLCQYYEVPPKRVAHFFGREAVLQEIGDGFQSSNVVILQGMGGQGKTQVALEFCHRARESSVYEGIFWVDASSEAQVRRSFEAILDTIKQSENVFETPEQGIAFIKKYIQNRSRPWLMVFDNYDDPVGFPHIADFLPAGACHVLFTTRHADVGRYGTLMVLRGLEENESLDMLFHRLSCERDIENVQHAKRIVERLGYHPLALDQASAYISKRKATLSLAHFVEHYNKRRKDILNSTPKVWEYRRKQPGEDQDHSLSVFTTWEMSFNRLLDEVKNGEQYSGLLDLLAYCHNGDISESLFSNFWSHLATCRSNSTNVPIWLRHFTENGDWSQDRFQDALVELCGLALIESQYIDDQGFLHVSLHPLVRDWIQMRADPELRYEQTIHQARLLESYIEATHPGAFFQFPADEKQAVFSHLAAMVENHKDHIRPLLKKKDIELLVDLYHNFAGFLQFCHKPVDAEIFLHQALEVLSLDEEVAIVRLLALKSWLGTLFSNQGRHEEAEAMFREVEDSFLVSSTGDTPERIRNLIAIAESLTSQGLYSESETMLLEIVPRASESLGGVNPLTLHALSRLAAVLRIVGELTGARSLYEEILEHNRRELGDDHPQTLVYYHNLGVLLSEVGKFKESEEIHRRCLDLRTEKLGSQHPQTLQSAVTLGVDWLDMGRYRNAEELLEKTLALEERIYGYGNLRTMSTLHYLCIAYLRNGKTDKAIEAGERCLDSREHALGCLHPDTLHTLRSYALVVSKKGQHDYAERLLCEVSQCQKLMFLENHHDVLHTEHDLATVVRDSGQYGKAKKLFLRVWRKKHQ
jgi:tetratricopeptide (TPR) repeat protein